MCHPDAPSSPAPDVETRVVAVDVPDGGAMDCYLALAPGAQPRPAVVIVGDIFGARSPFVERLARELAAIGLDALVPEYFFRQGPLERHDFEAAYARKAQLDERRTLVDLDAAVQWMRDRPECAGTRVGTVGFCLGGTFVLGLAARRSDLATVVYYGFPAGPPGPPSPQGAPTPLEVVDRISGPILGFWGDRDERVGMHNVAALREQLAARSVPFECVIYPGLDHGFLAAGFEPSGPGHHEAQESWAAAKEFLLTQTTS